MDPQKIPSISASPLYCLASPRLPHLKFKALLYISITCMIPVIAHPRLNPNKERNCHNFGWRQMSACIILLIQGKRGRSFEKLMEHQSLYTYTVDVRNPAPPGM